MPLTWINELRLSEVRAALAEADGSGVRVALLDSGIDTSHRDLGGLSKWKALSSAACRIWMGM
jgi:subtilisin family serine protease